MLVDPEFVKLSEEDINFSIRIYSECGYNFTYDEMVSFYTHKKIDNGLYMIAVGHGLNFERSLPDVQIEYDWPPKPQVPGYWYQSRWIENGTIPAYGVCDSPMQFMEKIGNILDKLPEEYVVGFDKIVKKEEEPGGWRWSKWGEYIGNQKPQCEYLYDEPEIEEVFLFTILRRVKA